MTNEKVILIININSKTGIKRREFLAAAGSMAILPQAALTRSARGEHPHSHAHHTHTAACATYATPAAAMQSERETLAYVPAIYSGTGRPLPDHLTTVDVNPDSKTYSQVIHRLQMPYLGDELHHYGWNVCSSCHGQPGKVRQYLVIPGLNSGNYPNHFRAPQLMRPVSPSGIYELNLALLTAPQVVGAIQGQA